MNSTVKSFIQYIVFLAIGLLILYLSYINFSAAYLDDCARKGIPAGDCSLWQKLVTDFKNADFKWIVLITLLYIVSNIFRTLRWKQLLQPIGYNPSFINALGATMIGYLANLGLPRLGEVVKPGILTKYDQVPLEKGIGTIVVDRVADVLSLVVIIGLAFLLSFGTFQSYFEEHFSLERSTSLMYLAGFAGMGLVILFFINRLIQQKEARHPLVVKLKQMWTGFMDGLLSVRKVKNLPLFILYSMLIWLMYYLMTYLCFFAYEPTAHLGMTAGLVVFVFGTLGIVFPSPGGMGSYHFLVTQALIIYGLDSVDAFSFSNIVFFSIQLFGNILLGTLFIILLPIFNKK